MRIFSFDPEAYRDEFESQGWVHITQGVTEEFLDYMKEYISASFMGLEGFAIAGKKEQSLFEFPDGADYPNELFEMVSRIGSLNRPTMTLSERHIQSYDGQADPQPTPHKDRYASQVSVGFSIDTTPESELVLYPNDERQLNPYNSAHLHHKRLQPQFSPEHALQDATEVVISDEPGDVIIFPGSRTWHLRRKAAHSVILYCKFNDFECDPLGEDPFTPVRRNATLGLIERESRARLSEASPVMARQLDYLSLMSMRQDDEAMVAHVWGQEPMLLSDTQAMVLRSMANGSTVREITGGLATGDRRLEGLVDDVVRLADLGVIDLIAASA